MGPLPLRMPAEPTYRWWCAHCDRLSEETFDSSRAAHEAGVDHIGEADHGLTTIHTPEADDVDE